MGEPEHGNGTMTMVKRDAKAIAFEARGGLALRTFDDVQRIAIAAAESGYFRDVRSAAQAMMKVIWGAELGIQPMTAMQGIYFFDGKMTLSGALIVALLQATGTDRSPIREKYRYKVIEHDVEFAREEKSGKPTGPKSGKCVLEWSVDGEVVGRSSYTIDEASLAGLLTKHNWQAHGKWMLFWRALTGGARMYAGTVAVAIYTPEEINPSLVVDAASGAVLSTAPPESGEPAKDVGPKKGSSKAARAALESVGAGAEKVPTIDDAKAKAEAMAAEGAEEREKLKAEADAILGEQQTDARGAGASVTSSKEDASSVAAPTPTVETKAAAAPGGTTDAFAEAWKAMPTELKKMDPHVRAAVKAGGLNAEQEAMLRLRARAVFNGQRKIDEHSAMSDDEAKLYDKAKALVG